MDDELVDPLHIDQPEHEEQHDHHDNQANHHHQNKDQGDLRDAKVRILFTSYKKNGCF
jgi:hypothetical protein